MPMQRHTRLFVLLCILLTTNSQFCSSLCQKSDSVHCVSTGPGSCAVNRCATNFFNSGDCTTYYTNTALVLYQNTANISNTWTISTANTGLNCSVVYKIGLGWTYNYKFYNKLVGWDYLSRTVPINIPHYQIKFRFSIAYIGIWSKYDYLWLRTYDGIQTVDYNLTYNCTPGVNTDFICNLQNASNHVDCLQNYEYFPLHNTSTMFFNFTFISDQGNSMVQFWNLYDFLVIAVKCDASCATCYSSTPTTCFSCANGYYLSPNNTCTSTCIGSLYVLPSPLNPLTGQCVSACPQGYYLNGTTCNQCQSGCLVCTSATYCTLSSPQNPTYKSIWSTYLGVWILIILLSLLLLIAICWRLFFYTKPIHVDEMKMIGDQRNYDQKVTVNDSMAGKQNQPNILHIEDMDYQDNVVVDQNPRRRKRLEQDMFRTNTDF